MNGRVWRVVCLPRACAEFNARGIEQFSGGSSHLSLRTQSGGTCRASHHGQKGSGSAGGFRCYTARLSGNVRQPNHVLANSIAGHKAERRPGAGEEWLAATKHDGVEVESILINKTKVG
jgi:hypothetical protein